MRPVKKFRRRTRRISHKDFEFLVGTELFRATPEEAKSSLMFGFQPKWVKSGERFITQGDKGDRFYIIQEGSCVVSFEKDGEIHPVCRLKQRELVGEMAVLTGENRTAHVDAETDMVLWGITREAFDEICRMYPSAREYLTEIVTYRLSSQKIMADRSIGKYVVNEIVDKGGWSVVYKGVHSLLNMPVAIKMLKHNLAMDPEFLTRFENEAKVIAKLDHDNIVRVYDIEHLYRTVFIVMEYLNGFSLRYILEHMPRMSISRMLDVVMQVCAGLSYAHAQGVVHQDMKPGNIVVQTDGRAKIVDFGLACPRGCAELAIAGTVNYMAPEQINGDPVDERTDIYSLGITAYEMATGQVPFPYQDPIRVVEAHLTEEIPDPRRLNPTLSEEIWQFIIKATRKEPGRRYDNVHQILEHLSPLAQRTGVSTNPGPREKRKVMSLFMLYNDDQQKELNGMLEEFGRTLKQMGVDLHLGSLEKV